jgi:uncharacterized membrane protein
MNKRPRIKPKLTAADKTFEVLGWSSTVALLTFTIISYANLADTIPIHYNGSGQADGFGRKENIFVLPSVATFLFIGLTILNNFPHVFNYPITITTDNAVRHYTNATRLLRALKLIIVVIFGWIVLKTVNNENGKKVTMAFSQMQHS